MLLLLCCFKLNPLDILANARNCDHVPELVDRKGGAGGRLLTYSSLRSLSLAGRWLLPAGRRITVSSNADL